MALKLALITGIPFALFSLAALLFFTEWSRDQFLTDSRRVGEEGEEEMRANADRVLTDSHTIVRRLVEKITQANRRDLAELPFELWGVDEEVEKDIKEEIRIHGEDLRERSLANAAVINREFRKRSEERLENRVGALRARQEHAGRLFARRLQGHTVAFLTASNLLLATALWAGLWFTVIKPVRRIRVGTEKVGAGDLSYRIATTSRDELGELGESFNLMSGKLLTSLDALAAKQGDLEEANREIVRWNKTLEERVKQKTAELEASLETLQRTQTELIHAAKMAGIGTLAGGIAHEFNNMLAGIRGCTEEALEEEDPAEVKEALRVIHRTAGRACAVVENLLRFSRKEPARFEAISLAEAARETLKLLEGEIARSAIEVETAIEGEGAIEGDSSQMHQVFLNLLTNAVHALEEAAEKRIRVALKTDGDGVRVEVDDSGPGVDEAIRDRLFDPFFTTKDGSGPGKRMGTGLGLSVTYGIIEEHGGTIEAGRSDLGGARFRIRLPVKR